MLDHEGTQNSNKNKILFSKKVFSSVRKTNMYLNLLVI